MEYIIAGLIIILVILLELVYQLVNKNNEPGKKEYHYSKKKLITDNELFFYNCFEHLDLKYIIVPQVNLAAIINKEEYHKYQNELNRNLDFGIFDQDFNILLAIEINDDSHIINKRRYRDYKVKDLLKKCNIELLIFNINYPNTEESVIARTNKILKNK